MQLKIEEKRIMKKLPIAFILLFIVALAKAQWTTVSGTNKIYRSGITSITGYGTNSSNHSQFQSIQSGTEFSGFFFNGHGSPDGVLRVKGTWEQSTSPILQVEANSGSGYNHEGNIRMVVLGNGNVGIGNGNPTRKLHVSGDSYIAGKVGMGTNNLGADFRLYVKDGIRTERIRVDIASTNGWADYVFDKDYKLMPLSDVEFFIKQNQHLPNIPSAKQVVEDGIDLGEMDALLLSKIEELTLHLIDANKRIESLEKELATKASK